MEYFELGEVQTYFANIIWDHEPISSGELVKICRDKLQWKKSTTYTVLHKLCEKGLFQNQNGTVTSLVSREEFYSVKTHQFVDETFRGSLPAFIAAFAAGKPISAKEAEEIQRLINSFKKED